MEDGPTVTHCDPTYHFCSGACKRAFEKTPDEFDAINPAITIDHAYH